MLRALWTEQSVTVDGRFHHIDAAGLAPLPVQRPIPIWIGAFAPAALRRVGRLADGWFPHARPGGGLEHRARAHPRRRGRGGTRHVRLPLRGPARLRRPRPRQLGPHPRRWREAGASHLSVITMHAGLEGADAHINAIRRMPALLPHPGRGFASGSQHEACRTSRGRCRTPVPTSPLARSPGSGAASAAPVSAGHRPTSPCCAASPSSARVAGRDRVRGRHRRHDLLPGPA